jgi:hypothetical protein
MSTYPVMAYPAMAYPVMAEPLSTNAQIGLKVPLLLVALAGVVVALVNLRRLGVPAAVLAAAGGAMFALDQAINIAFAEALSRRNAVDLINRFFNTFTLLDFALLLSGTVLLIAAVLVRRPATGSGGRPALATDNTDPYSTET